MSIKIESIMKICMYWCAHRQSVPQLLLSAETCGHDDDIRDLLIFFFFPLYWVAVGNDAVRDFAGIDLRKPLLLRNFCKSYNWHHHKA